MISEGCQKVSGDRYEQFYPLFFPLIDGNVANNLSYFVQLRNGKSSLTITILKEVVLWVGFLKSFWLYFS